LKSPHPHHVLKSHLYPPHLKARWSRLAEIPFDPDSALARSFEEVPAEEWDNLFSQDRTALGWVVQGLRKEDNEDNRGKWFSHLVRCGGNPWRGMDRKNSSNPLDVPVTYLLDQAGALSSSHWSAVSCTAMLETVLKERGTLSDPFTANIYFFQALVGTRRLDWITKVAQERTEMGYLPFCLSLVPTDYTEFAVEALKSVLAQGLSWPRASEALPDILTWVRRDPELALQQLFLVWDRDDSSLNSPPPGWNDSLGKALLSTTPDIARRLKEGLEARLKPEQRVQWLPNLPSCLLAMHEGSAPISAGWWETKQWPQIPVVIRWAVEWGLPSDARLGDQMGWAVALVFQWKDVRNQGFFADLEQKEKVKGELWEGLTCLAQGGYALNTLPSKDRMEQLKKAMKCEFFDSMEEWMKAVSRFPGMEDTLERYSRLTRVEELTAHLTPDKMAPARNKPRF